MKRNNKNSVSQIENQNRLGNKIEVVVPILELYESVEDDLRKIGIRIRLDLYDGMDSCIYAVSYTHLTLPTTSRV